jgi:hypothetical protein
MSAGFEKLCIVLAVVSAVAIFLTGLSMALHHQHFHTLNRAGAAIVCVEGLLVLVEFARRTRLRQAEEHLANNPYVIIESLRAERQIIAVAVGLAVVGEFLHGFGDSLLEFFAG